MADKQQQQQQQQQDKDAAEMEAAGSSSGGSSSGGSTRFACSAFSAAAWIILIHELLERFSFYGMKGILTYYLIYLGFDDDAATVLYHLFTAISYLTPILGTFMSDNFFGRYKTVVVLGIVYLIGHVLMPLTALTKNQPGPLIAMLILAIGTGGIKPCVASFGGDQIDEDNEPALEAFFAMFYMCINIGAFVSQLLTPILREQVDCLDGFCYPLAFGVPAGAFVICYILFLAGTPKYRMCPRPKVAVLNKAFGALFSGKLKKGAELSDERPEEGVQSEREFVMDARQAFRVCFLFLPFPIYWALFDQQGSRWVLQGRAMDGYISEGFSLTADQMQSVNPLLICIVVPIFNNVVYPLLAKAKLLTTATSRIFTGYLICSAAFVLTGCIDLFVDSRVPQTLPNERAAVQVYNANNCSVQLVSNFLEERTMALESHATWSFEINNNSHGALGVEKNFFNFTSSCGSGAAMSMARFQVQGNSTNLVVLHGAGHSAAMQVPYDVSDTKLRLVMVNPAAGDWFEFGAGCSPASNFTTSGSFKANDYCTVARRQSVPLLLNGEEKYTVSLSEGATIKYVTVVAIRQPDGSYQIVQSVDRGLYPLHLALQLPQYLLMCISEVLFSVTAMAYAYSEAPEGLRALLQSAYLVSIFFGNMIVIVVALLPTLPKRAYEFFLFAGLVLIGGFVQLYVIRVYNKMKGKGASVEPLQVEMDPVDEKKKPEEEAGEDEVGVKS